MSIRPLLLSATAACLMVLGWSAMAEPRVQAEDLIRMLPASIADAGTWQSGPEGSWSQVGVLVEPGTFMASQPCEHDYGWQVLPQGLLYPNYLAGGRESRFASHWVFEKDQGWLWDIALGGRAAMLRYGTSDPLLPEGFQVDIEGAAFPRLLLEDDRRLGSSDFRFGVPLTVRRGPLEGKLGYYHLSSHLGDEFMVENPDVERVNYSRDVIVLAIAFRPHDDFRLYAETGWAFFTDGGSKPWEFQFGADYSPIQWSGFFAAPFFAINGRIREEVDFGGNLTVETGLQWRGQAGSLVRGGFYYFNGKSDQYQFFREHEEQTGIGLWYDF